MSWSLNLSLTSKNVRLLGVRAPAVTPGSSSWLVSSSSICVWFACEPVYWHGAPVRTDPTSIRNQFQSIRVCRKTPKHVLLLRIQIEFSVQPWPATIWATWTPADAALSPQSELVEQTSAALGSDACWVICSQRNSAAHLRLIKLSCCPGSSPGSQPLPSTQALPVCPPPTHLPLKPLIPSPECYAAELGEFEPAAASNYDTNNFRGGFVMTWLIVWEVVLRMIVDSMKTSFERPV